jgi:hypothetical protein
MSSNRAVSAVAATLALAALVLPLSLVAIPAHAASRTLSEAFPIRSTDRLELRIPFGEVEIEAVDGRSVQVRVEATCDPEDDCGNFLDRLRVESKIRGRTLSVRLEGVTFENDIHLDGSDDEGDEGYGERRRHVDRHRKSSLRVIVQVPRSLRVDVKMGAGSLEIAGVGKDLNIDLGAGEIVVRSTDRSVGSIRVDLAVGEVQIHHGGRTRDYARILGGPVRWNEGRGESGIDVDLGAGSVDVTLE